CQRPGPLLAACVSQNMIAASARGRYGGHELGRNFGTPSPVRGRRAAFPSLAADSNGTFLPELPAKAEHSGSIRGSAHALPVVQRDVPGARAGAGERAGDAGGADARGADARGTDAGGASAIVAAARSRVAGHRRRAAARRTAASAA